MNRSGWLMALALGLALVLLAAPAAEAKNRAAQKEGVNSCGLSGTWYGFNDFGDTVLTITRIGKGRYSVIFDAGHSQVVPPATATSDWRGEMVKIGGKKYQFKSIATLPLEEGLGVPMALGVCDMTTKQTGCYTFKSRGSCTYLGFFHGQDPFTEGFPLVEEPEKLKNRFWRMRPVSD